MSSNHLGVRLLTIKPPPLGQECMGELLFRFGERWVKFVLLLLIFPSWIKLGIFQNI